MELVKRLADAAARGSEQYRVRAAKAQEEWLRDLEAARGEAGAFVENDLELHVQTSASRNESECVVPFDSRALAHAVELELKRVPGVETHVAKHPTKDGDVKHYVYIKFDCETWWRSL